MVLQRLQADVDKPRLQDKAPSTIAASSFHVQWCCTILELQGLCAAQWASPKLF